MSAKIERPSNVLPFRAANSAVAKLENAVEVRNAAENSAEIWLNGECGWDFTAAATIEQLKAIDGKGKKVRAFLASPGGDVFEGYQIGNFILTMDAEVVVYVQPLAASIASFIAVCADRVVMPANSMMMIHNASALVSGEAADLETGAALLRKLNGQLAAAYSAKRQMGMRRPIQVYNEVNEIRGCFRPLDPNLRRIHLGMKQRVTPTDEGVRVLHGLWFNSDELQQCLDGIPVPGKVDVFFDPDNLSAATVLLPRVQKPIEVRIQITAFADLTAAEALELMTIWKKEDPRATELHEDRIHRIRRERADTLRFIGVERKLKRSYSIQQELETKARHLMAGARIIPVRLLPGTTAPGSITDLTGSRAISHRTGRADMLMDGHAIHVADVPTTITALPVATTEEMNARPKPQVQRPAASAGVAPPKPARGSDAPMLGRPTSVKRLE